MTIEVSCVRIVDKERLQQLMATKPTLHILTEEEITELISRIGYMPAMENDECFVSYDDVMDTQEMYRIQSDIDQERKNQKAKSIYERMYDSVKSMYNKGLNWLPVSRVASEEPK